MVRRTYHYDEQTKQMVEGPAPSRTAGSGDGWRFSDRLYSGSPFVAHDGTLIDSKRKHRAYMKRHNLSTVDDYSNTWAEAAKQRAAFFEGRHDKRARREAVARAWEKVHG